MAKVRMNQTYRAELFRMAAEMLSTIIKKELDYDTKYQAFKNVALARIKNEYPEKDMAILRKYDLVKRPGSFEFVRTSDKKILSVGFTEDECPERPKRPGWYSDILLSGDFPEFDAAEGCSSQLEKIQAVRMSDYRSLINESNYLEQIEEIWPEASKIRSKFSALKGTTTLVKVTEPMIARIKEDVEKVKSLNEEAA